MNIEVKLFASFRDDRFKVKHCSFEHGTSVKQVLDQLGIDAEEVGVTMINGRHCPVDAVLSEGDTLGIFPMIGGG